MSLERPLHAQVCVFDLHTCSLKLGMSKANYLKVTHHSVALFKSVEYINVIEDLGLNAQPGGLSM